MENAELVSRFAQVFRLQALCSTDDPESCEAFESCAETMERLHRRYLARAYEEVLAEDVAAELEAN